MSAGFDPYHKWLGIRPDEQPPTHYRLLGVAEFESDGDVITLASDRQMSHVRTFQTGPHSALTQKLLNELAAAKLTLLKPERRAAYDFQLRAQRASAEPQVVETPREVPAAAPSIGSRQPAPQVPTSDPQPQRAAPVASDTPVERLPRPTRLLISAAGGLGVMAGLLLMLVVFGGNETPGTTERAAVVEPVQKPVEPAANPAPVAPAEQVAKVEPAAKPEPPKVEQAAGPAGEETPRQPIAPHETVDLLKLVELPRDVILGNAGSPHWETFGNAVALTSSDPKFVQAVSIPYHPTTVPYRIDLLADRVGQDTGPLNLGLWAGGRQFLVKVDFGYSSAVGMVNGDSYYDNAWRRQVFSPGKVIPITVLVDSEKLSVIADGKLLIDKFDHRHLTRSNQFSGVFPDNLSLGWQSAVMRIWQAELRTLAPGLVVANPWDALQGMPQLVPPKDLNLNAAPIIAEKGGRPDPKAPAPAVAIAPPFLGPRPEIVVPPPQPPVAPPAAPPAAPAAVAVIPDVPQPWPKLPDAGSTSALVKAVNLLSAVDLNRDQLKKGMLEWDGPTLVGHWQRVAFFDGFNVQFPVSVRGSRYRVDFVAESFEGGGQLVLGFNTATQQGQVTIAGESSIRVGGFEAVTTENVVLFPRNLPSKVSIEVMDDTLSITIDERTLLDGYQITHRNNGRTSDWKPKSPTFLTLGWMSGSFRIHSCYLVDLTEAPRGETERQPILAFDTKPVVVPFWTVPQVRLPIPDYDVVSQRGKLLRDSFPEDYRRATTVSGKASLAQLLAAEAMRLKLDDDTRYALLQEALRLGTDGAQPQLVHRVIELLGARWEVDGCELEAEAMSEIAKLIRDPNASTTFTEFLLRLAERAESMGKVKEAARFAAQAQVTANRTSYPNLRRDATQTYNRLKALQTDAEAAERLHELLKANPDDPTANLALGKRLCLKDDQWDEGLKLLAKCNEHPLADLAQRDRAAPQAADAQLALADAMWNEGKQPTDVGKLLKLRSAHWYRTAEPNLAPADQARAKSRIDEVAQIARPN